MKSTNDPSLKSFIPVKKDSPFPIQNLPYGVFKPRQGGQPRIGTAIGDYVVDLAALEDEGFFAGPKLFGEQVFNQVSLNAFMALGKRAWQEARSIISELLREDEPTLRDHPSLREKTFYKQSDVELLLPVEIGDYTDFYSSREHATNVGTIFRGKENALQPNWLYLPVGYHGRASSVILSGEHVHRPNGQIKPSKNEQPVVSPTRRMDFELEMGYFVGTGNDLGVPVSVDKAYENIFGFCIVNDWSARDIQAWEYVPLGPFLAKNFATSISPWIVTLDALEPFRQKGPEQNPSPLPYLQSSRDWAYDIKLEVSIRTENMQEPYILSRSNYAYLYWDMCQQLAHHTMTGCNVRTGDLMATGTISGPTPDTLGSLLELTGNGSKSISLPNGEERKFLEDGDEITMRAWCEGDGYRIGFGEVTTTILPAHSV